MESDGSAVRFSYHRVQKFYGPGARRERRHFKRGRLLSEELGFGPVVNKFPEVPRQRFTKVDHLLLPAKGEVIIEAYGSSQTSAFPVDCFLHTDDWCQIRLRNEVSYIVQFRILYYNPMEMILKLIICKEVPPHASSTVVMNALGQPLRCTGCRWPFGIKAFVAESNYLDLDFFDWPGADLVPIGNGLPVPKRPVAEKKELEPIAEEIDDKKEEDGIENGIDDLNNSVTRLTMSTEVLPVLKKDSHYEMLKRKKKKTRKVNGSKKE